MSFKKQISYNEYVLTGFNSNFQEIAQVTRKGDKIKGSCVKIRKNAQGDIVEVYNSSWATNFRRNVRHNLQTGEVKSTVLNIDLTGKYILTSTILDKFGKVFKEAKNVKIKGKTSVLG